MARADKIAVISEYNNMQTFQVKLSQLVTNDDNPRTITDGNLQKLITSILVFPKMLALRPIVVDNTMTALGGNMRLRALTAIATFSPEQIANRLQGSTDYESKTPAEREALINYWREWLEDPTTEVASDETLSEDERRAFIIKDNVGYGEWDMEALQASWDEKRLGEWNVDTAWDADTDMEAEANTTEEDNYTEQDAEEAITRATRGDIWQLGNHRLMCGDSTQWEDVTKLMDGAEADMLLTDPPYNVAYVGKNEKELTIQNDRMEDASFRAFLTDAFRNAEQAMRKGATFYIWHADSEGFNFRAAVKSANLALKQCLVWVKHGSVLSRQDYNWKHEPCLYGWKEGAAHYFCKDFSQNTVYEDVPRENYRAMRKDELLEVVMRLTAVKEHTTVINEPYAPCTIHPTMKPIKLMGKLVRNSTQKGWKVLDLFGGSGSTLIACEQLGRQCYMMELDTRYCDAIIDRWEKLTGQTAVLISNT